MRVLIVDDHLAFAEAIAVCLRADPGVHGVELARTAREAEAVVERFQPDVALVDVALGADSGIELIPRLLALHPALRVVVVSGHQDSATVCESVRWGALGFVSKDSGPEDLLRAARGVMNGESWIPPRLLASVLKAFQQPQSQLTPEQAQVEKLSPREREVLALMVAGLDRAAIARSLYLSANTVRTHAQKVLTKLDVHSTLEAVSIALRAGVRPPESVKSSKFNPPTTDPATGRISPAL